MIARTKKYFGPKQKTSDEIIVGLHRLFWLESGGGLPWEWPVDDSQAVGVATESTLLMFKNEESSFTNCTLYLTVRQDVHWKYKRRFMSVVFLLSTGQVVWISAKRCVLLRMNREHKNMT